MAALLGEAPRPAGVKGEEQDDAQGGNNAAAAAEPAGPAGEGVKAEPGVGPGEGGGAAPMDVDGAGGEAGGGHQHAQQGDGQQPGAGMLQASGSSAMLFKEEPAPGEERQPRAAQQQQAAAQQQQAAAAGGPGPKAQAHKPLHPSVAKLAKADSMQPSSAGVSQSGADAGGTETEPGTTVDQQGPQPLRPVSTAASRGRLAGRGVPPRPRAADAWLARHPAALASSLLAGCA